MRISYRQVNAAKMVKAMTKTLSATNAETLAARLNAAPAAHMARDVTQNTSDHMTSGMTKKISFSPPPRLSGPLVTVQPSAKHNASGAKAKKIRQEASFAFGLDMSSNVSPCVQDPQKVHFYEQMNALSIAASEVVRCFIFSTGVARGIKTVNRYPAAAGLCPRAVSPWSDPESPPPYGR